MSLMEIEIDENLIPEGYEPVAYRNINEGELYCSDYNEVVEGDLDIIGNLGLILKKKRWRADIGRIYYYVSAMGEVIGIEDHREYADNEHFDVLNYYKTSEEAEKAAKRVRAAYIGESE